MSELIQTGQHPDADQLNAFVEHVLPPHEQEQTMAHLAGCPACRQVVALSLPPEDERQTEVVRRHWFPRWRPAWAGIPALAAVILVVFFVRKSEKTVRQTPAPAQMAEARPAAPPPAEDAATAVRIPTPLRQRLNQNRAVAAAKQPSPVGQREPAGAGGSAGGVMGGILGGIGSGPTQPSAPARSFAPPSASAGGPATALAVNRAVLFAPSPLPSQLAILSMASRANQRIAIDTDHHLFCSDDEGRSWTAVASPWKGRAVGVALTSDVSNGRHVPPLLVMSSHAAVNRGGASFGSIAGAIKDPSGAVIPGATVVAIHSGGTSVRSVTTDSQGRFRIEDLVPGSYRVEAQAPGFLRQSFAAEVTPSQQAEAVVALPAGSAAESVMVQARPSPPGNALAATKPAPSQTLSPFVLTTDDGEHWTSTDGQSWTRQ